MPIRRSNRRSQFRGATPESINRSGRDGPAVGRAFVMRAFRRRSFTILWTTMLLYRVGFWVGAITFQWLVARLTDNSPLMLGLLAFFNLIPMLVITPLGGVVADRLDRRQVMVVTQFSMGAVAGLLALLVVVGRADSVVVLFCFAFVFGVVLSFNAPANQAAIANSVPDEDLGSAVSLNAIGLNLARIGGPALAGPIILAWGAGASFGLWALVSLVATVGISRIAFRPYEPEVDSLGVLGRIAQGFEHVRERRHALLALGLVAVVAIFGTSYSSVIAVIAYDTLGQGDGGFTLLFVFTGIGAMAGALVAGARRLPLNLPRLALWAAAYGLVQAAFAMSRSLWMALALIALVGGLNFFLMTSLNVLLQHLAAEAKRGRVMSLFMLAWGGLHPIGSLSLGFVGELISVPTALVVFALVLIGFSLWVRSAARSSTSFVSHPR